MGDRTTPRTPARSRATHALDVVVVGAGFGGIGLAMGLLTDGHHVTVVDKQDGVGGTWRANTYPGAACDIPSHLYSFSFAPKDDWSRVYAPQPEILAYLEGVAADHGLDEHLLLGTEVTRAVYDEDRCGWDVHLDTGEVLRCDLVVSATGQLSRPLVPALDGLDAFPGAVFHSATWDHDAPLDDARVAVVGSGASAMQFLPPLAERARHLTLFQRTPPWVIGRMDRPFTPVERAALRAVPGLRRAYRLGIWTWKELSWAAFVEGSTANGLLRRLAERRLAQRVDDPVLRDQLRPDFTPGCKRILASDEWYDALQREDVDVLATGVARIDGSTVVGHDGSCAEVDAIVFGTGFRATELLAPMEVAGRDGRDLHTAWSGGASAHLGMTVHGFPNLFVLYGPNTNLSHNSIIHMLESQMAHVRDAARRIADGEADALEVREQVQTAFTDSLAERMERLVWDSGCSSWYLGDGGRNTLNWPGLTAEYRLRARRVALTDHVVHRRPATVEDAADVQAPSTADAS